MMGPNARKNNYEEKKSHDVSGSESIPMDTPDVPTFLTPKTQVIP